MFTLYYKTRNFIKEHERFLMPTAMALGFVVDSFTLTRIDRVFDNVILLFYLALASGSILLMNIREVSFSSRRLVQRITTFLPYTMQYAFGGLFSGLAIFYSRSGNIVTSFPFILMLFVLLVGNEFVHTRYPRLTFQVSLFFIALFSYTTMVTPIIIGHINVWAFLLGALISVALIFLYLRLLARVTPPDFIVHTKALKISIASIFSAFLLLYFLNIIPPIPLSLKDGGVYHSIERGASGAYIFHGEPLPWYVFYKKYNPTFHRVGSESAYIFSAVFAPTRLQSTIYHEWSYFDSKKNRWIDAERVPIGITGGRDGGYRGYSFKSSLTPGLWRVDIETKRGQVIGRIKFKVKNVATPPPLETEIF